MRWGRAALLWVAGACLVLMMSMTADAATASVRSEARIIFTIDVPRITESSSLAVSTIHPGLVYTTNDSGDGPYVYVLDHHGRLVGTTTLAGVDAVDIEAISAGSDGTLVIGDIGDNDGKRSTVPIYRIPQPGRGDHTVTPKMVSLTYRDGPRNAESLAYDPASGRVIIASKEMVGHLYRTPPKVFSRRTATLTEVADAPMISTDATLLPSGHALVVRTYHDAVIYHYPSFTFWKNLDLPTEQMGESIAAVPGRRVVYAGSEGENSPVWSVPLPPLHAPTRASSSTTGVEPSSAAPTPAVQPAAAGASLRSRRVVSVAEDRSGWSAGRIGSTTVVVLLATGAVVLLSRRRSSR